MLLHRFKPRWQRSEREGKINSAHGMLRCRQYGTVMHLDHTGKLARLDPQPDRTPDDLIRAAEAALREAKQAGRYACRSEDAPQHAGTIADRVDVEEAGARDAVEATADSAQ